MLVGGASPTLVLTNHETAAYETSDALSTQVAYYLSVSRSEAGDIVVAIYSDSGRTTLVQTLSVETNANRSWRYLFALDSYNDGTSHTVSVDVENLSRVASAASPAQDT